MFVSIGKPSNVIKCSMDTVLDGSRGRMSLTEYEEAYADLNERFIAAFFDKDNIVQSMALLMIQYHPDTTPSDDSISAILSTMCSTRVAINLSQRGFVPFKQDPLLMIPYINMTEAQLQVVYESTKLCKQNSEYTSCSQMGGGVSVFMTPPLQMEKTKSLIKPALVMYGLYVLLKKNTTNQSQHSKLYSILIQRLTYNTHILPEEILESRVLCQSSHNDAKLA